MNDKNFIEELRQKREEYGVTQTRLAVACGISREYYNRIEKGKQPLNDELREVIEKQIERFNPQEPLFLLIDYFRVRFPTTDALAIIRDVLQLKSDYMLYEDYGKYGYESKYVLGDINIMCSMQEHLGVLLELKGKGCRQMECYLLAQERSWYDFMLDCMTAGGVMKRLDLAINDRAGILDIPKLKEKYKAGECVSYFRMQKDYSGTEKCGSDLPKNTGETLYLGSTSSELYMCAYQKNYEQYVKNGTEIEDTEIKNRFEIRMKNERAYYAVVDLLTYRDAERTAFSIINHYVRFVDRGPSEVYIGNSVHNMQSTVSFKSKKKVRKPESEWFRVENTHEPIIDKEVFYRVQEQIKSRRRQTKEKATPIFAGLVKCADCGWSMRFGTNKANKTPYSYYACSYYGQFGKGNCSMHYIRYDVLYQAVLERLQYWAKAVQQDEEKVLNKIQKAGNAERIREKKKKASTLKKAENRQNEIDRLFAKMYEDRACEKITERNFVMLSSKYQKEQIELEQQITSLREELSKMEQDMIGAEKWIELIKEYSVPKELTAPLLNAMIEKILIHEATTNEDNERIQEIEIYYRFIGKVE